MEKLTIEQVRAAVAEYNRKNAAFWDYLHTVSDGVVYRRAVREIPAELCVQSCDSKTGEKVIRLKAEKVAKFVMQDAEPVCTVEDLQEIRRQNPGATNDGEALEFYYKRIHEGATHWVKDSTPFWVAGDVTIDGAEVQLKFGGARLAAYRLLS